MIVIRVARLSPEKLHIMAAVGRIVLERNSKGVSSISNEKVILDVVCGRRADTGRNDVLDVESICN